MTTVPSWTDDWLGTDVERNDALIGATRLAGQLDRDIREMGLCVQT